MFGASLVIVAQIYDELSRGQTEFPRIRSQNGQSDIEGQCQWYIFPTPTESIPWCKFGANLVIPDEIGDELSCWQGKVYGQTDRRTDGWTQATIIPLPPERPRGKNESGSILYHTGSSRINLAATPDMIYPTLTQHCKACDNFSGLPLGKYRYLQCRLQDKPYICLPSLMSISVAVCNDIFEELNCIASIFSLVVIAVT